MPKPKLPEEFTNWMRELDAPDEVKNKIVESFEKSGVHKRYARLHADYTQKTQEAAEARKYAQQWEKFQEANPVLQHWDQVGPALQMHPPSEVVRRLATAQANGPGAAPSDATVQQVAHGMRANQARLAQLQRLQDSNELTWEQFTEAAKPLVGQIQAQQEQLDQMQASVSDFTKFQNEKLPQYAAGITATLQESNRAVASRLAESDREQIQRLRYVQQHPDRDVEEIYTHARNNNLAFLDAARDLYSEDDRETERTQITKPLADKNRELEEKLAQYEARLAQQQGSGEGPMHSSAVNIFTRPGRRQPVPQQARPVARTEGEVRSGIAEVIGRFQS